MILPVVRKQ